MDEATGTESHTNEMTPSAAIIGAIYVNKGARCRQETIRAVLEEQSLGEPGADCQA